MTITVFDLNNSKIKKNCVSLHFKLFKNLRIHPPCRRLTIWHNLESFNRNILNHSTLLQVVVIIFELARYSIVELGF